MGTWTNQRGCCNCLGQAEFEAIKTALALGQTFVQEQVTPQLATQWRSEGVKSICSQLIASAIRAEALWAFDFFDINGLFPDGKLFHFQHHLNRQSDGNEERHFLVVGLGPLHTWIILECTCYMPTQCPAHI